MPVSSASMSCVLRASLALKSVGSAMACKHGKARGACEQLSLWTMVRQGKHVKNHSRSTAEQSSRWPGTEVGRQRDGMRWRLLATLELT